jgi:hypothetical protein
MQKITAALILVSLIAATTLTQRAAMAQTRRDGREAGQGYRYQNRGFYNQNGVRYYDGYPSSDRQKMREGW